MIAAKRYGESMKVGDLVSFWTWNSPDREIGIILNFWSDHKMVTVLWGERRWTLPIEQVEVINGSR